MVALVALGVVSICCRHHKQDTVVLAVVMLTRIWPRQQAPLHPHTSILRHRLAVLQHMQVRVAVQAVAVAVAAGAQLFQTIR